MKSDFKFQRVWIWTNLHRTCRHLAAGNHGDTCSALRPQCWHSDTDSVTTPSDTRPRLHTRKRATGCSCGETSLREWKIEWLHFATIWTDRWLHMNMTWTCRMAMSYRYTHRWYGYVSLLDDLAKWLARSFTSTDILHTSLTQELGQHLHHSPVIQSNEPRKWLHLSLSHRN